jgi:sigma-B regulation protein RsbU (phosphoserine phosphatase)
MSEEVSVNLFTVPTQPPGFDSEIRKTLLKDSLIFGIGVTLVLVAFYLGRYIHWWAHGLCTCTPGLLVEYGPSSIFIVGASAATLWALRARSKGRLLANKKLESANRQIKKDLEAAASIQRSFLPQTAPDVKGLRFAWHFQPCEELAGDIFNMFPLNDRTLAMYSLDVSGHGVASALLSVTLNRILLPLTNESSTVRRYAGQSKYQIVSPVRVVELLNQQFMMNPEEPQYFTFLYGLVDVQTHRFSFVCAGHPGPLYLPSGAPPRILESPGYPVGLFEDATWQESSLQLHPGDRLYLYSDGITEAMNRQEEPFGPSRLLDVLIKGKDHSLEESVDLLMAGVHNFVAGPISDDMSILAAEVTVSG